MKRKFILLIMLMCALGGVKSSLLNAQENQDSNVVTIGEGKVNNYNVPFDIFRANSFGQQLFTSTEIGKTGTITSLSLRFYGETNYSDDHGETTTETPNDKNFTRNIRIYLTNVDISTLSKGVDIDNDYNTPNFAGDVTLKPGEWVTFNFTNNFNLEENKNLLVTIIDLTDKSAGSNLYWWYGDEKEGHTVARLANTAINNTSGFTLQDLSKKGATAQNYRNNIQLTFAESGETPTAPEKPTLTAPDINATDVYNPTLKFTLSDNTDSYEIYLDATETPNTKVATGNGSGDIEYSTSSLNLGEGTKYYWKVIATNTAGSIESDVLSFTTLDIPGAPTGFSPENNAIVSNDIELSWTFGNNSKEYKVFIKNGNSEEYVSSDYITANGQTGSIKASELLELQPNQSYSWYIEVKNEAGSYTTAPLSFSIASVLPINNYDILVSKNIETGNDDVTVEWEYADQNATHYRVYFGTTEELTMEKDWTERTSSDIFTIAVENNTESNDKYYFRVDVKKDENVANGNVVYCIVLDNDGNWSDSYNTANDVYFRANITSTYNVTAKNITIDDGGLLKITNNNASLTANTLTINEGGQFFATNTNTYFPIGSVKFNKNITNPDSWNDNNKTGWQLISSPLNNVPISNFVGNIEGDYDLYRFDATKTDNEWVNHKDNSNGFEENFQSGVGYLASYEKEKVASFSGNINRTNKLTIGGNGEMENPNVYLVGNPFLFNMNWESIINSNNTYGINNSFAVVKSDGAYEYKTSGEIKVGEGFFILTTEKWASFNYSFKATDIVTASASKSRNAEQSRSLNITAIGNAGKDNVVVNFNGENEGFPKLQNFNDAIATVYVQDNNRNYGVYNYNEDIQEIDLCFNAPQMGNYTISAQPNGKFKSLTLVDRFTGIETDLLVEDYNFTATSNDNYNRFIVKLVNGQPTTDNSHFAYVSGEELILSEEGAVEIIDMMGRIVYSSDAACHVNRIDVSAFNNAAYVVRVINENGVKVQKIIL